MIPPGDLTPATGTACPPPATSPPPATETDSTEKCAEADPRSSEENNPSIKPAISPNRPGKNAMNHFHNVINQADKEYSQSCHIISLLSCLDQLNDNLEPLYEPEESRREEEQANLSIPSVDHPAPDDAQKTTPPAPAHSAETPAERTETLSAPAEKDTGTSSSADVRSRRAAQAHGLTEAPPNNLLNTFFGFSYEDPFAFGALEIPLIHQFPHFQASKDGNNVEYCEPRFRPIRNESNEEPFPSLGEVPIIRDELPSVRLPSWILTKEGKMSIPNAEDEPINPTPGKDKDQDLESNEQSHSLQKDTAQVPDHFHHEHAVDDIQPQLGHAGLPVPSFQGMQSLSKDQWNDHTLRQTEMAVGQTEKKLPSDVNDKEEISADIFSDFCGQLPAQEKYTADEQPEVVDPPVHRSDAGQVIIPTLEHVDAGAMQNKFRQHGAQANANFATLQNCRNSLRVKRVSENTQHLPAPQPVLKKTPTASRVNDKQQYFVAPHYFQMHSRPQHSTPRSISINPRFTSPGTSIITPNTALSMPPRNAYLQRLHEQEAARRNMRHGPSTPQFVDTIQRADAPLAEHLSGSKHRLQENKYVQHRVSKKARKGDSGFFSGSAAISQMQYSPGAPSTTQKQAIISGTQQVVINVGIPMQASGAHFASMTGQPSLVSSQVYPQGLVKAEAQSMLESSNGEGSCYTSRYHQEQIGAPQERGILVKCERDDIPKAFKCETCEARFAFKENAERHVKVVHEGRKIFYCYHCPASYLQTKTLCNHIDKKHFVLDGSPPVLPCYWCSYRTDNEKDWGSHMQSTHPGRKNAIRAKRRFDT